MKYLDVPQSGSQADQVASRNRFGQYYRTRSIPTNPNTSLQTQARSRLGVWASSWASSTDSQRQAWQSCADRFPKTDSLGQKIVLSGFQQYVRSNTVLQLVSAAQAIPAADTPFGNNIIVADISAKTPKTFEIGYTPPPPGQWLFIYCSDQVSSGISFWSDYRLLAIQPASATGPAEELAKYELKFGPLLGGKRIFLKSRVLNECGVFGPDYVISVIVTAPLPTAARRRQDNAESKPTVPTARAEK